MLKFSWCEHTFRSPSAPVDFTSPSLVTPPPPFPPTTTKLTPNGSEICSFNRSHGADHCTIFLLPYPLRSQRYKRLKIFWVGYYIKQFEATALKIGTKVLQERIIQYIILYFQLRTCLQEKTISLDGYTHACLQSLHVVAETDLLGVSCNTVESHTACL